MKLENEKVEENYKDKSRSWFLMTFTLRDVKGR